MQGDNVKRHYGCTTAIVLLAIVAFAWPWFDVGGHCLGHFIAYSPAVPVVRKVLVALGSAMVIFAASWWIAARFRGKCVPLLMPDIKSLPLFLFTSFLIPFTCLELAVATNCDFRAIQCSASFVISLLGSLVAARTKRYRYILYYLVMFLLMGSFFPPT